MLYLEDSGHHQNKNASFLTGFPYSVTECNSIDFGFPNLYERVPFLVNIMEGLNCIEADKQTL